jgi:CheY-like chemotaxis protein
MQMPEMGGAEAIAAIRERERLSGGHIPIVAVTAHALAGDRERCLQMGADGYVAKPIVPGVLFEAIAAVTSGRRSAPSAIDVTPNPMAPMLARVGGDAGLLQEVIGLFLEDGPRMLELVRAGVSASDAQGTYRAAHTLKGSAGNFDAAAVLVLTQQLEQDALAENWEASRASFAQLDSAVAGLLTTLRSLHHDTSCAS